MNIGKEEMEMLLDSLEDAISATEKELANPVEQVESYAAVSSESIDAWPCADRDRQVKRGRKLSLQVSKNIPGIF